MKTRKRWWWWAALVGAVVLCVVIPVTFRWCVGWSDSHGRWHLFVESGILAIKHIEAVEVTPSPLAWNGGFQFAKLPFLQPWVAWPRFLDLGNDQWLFEFPLHFPLLAFVAVLALPYLPPIVKRRRRKAGLCVGCAYDLTGNESGRCPECGEAT